MDIHSNILNPDTAVSILAPDTLQDILILFIVKSNLGRIWTSKDNLAKLYGYLFPYINEG